MIVEWLVTQLVIYWQNWLRKIHRLRSQQQSLELRHLNDVDRCYTLISLFTLVMINEYFLRWYYERQQACFWTNYGRLATTASPSKREGPPWLFTPGPCLTAAIWRCGKNSSQAAQLSMKAALPLAKIIATASCRSSKIGPCHWLIHIILHGIRTYTCTGSRINDNCERIASWARAWFRIQNLPPPTAMTSVLTIRPRPFPQHSLNEIKKLWRIRANKSHDERCPNRNKSKN